MELVQRKPENVSITVGILSRIIHAHPTHLPCDDPERVNVACLRDFGARKSEALRVDQFGGSTVEELIDVYPWQGGRNRGCSEAGNTDMSTSVDEDVGLDEYEPVAET